MTYGCHSCGVDLSKYKSYDESPCASCKLTKEAHSAHTVEMFESADIAEEADQLNNIAQEDDPLADFSYDLPVLEKMKEVCEAQVLTVASGIILKLLSLVPKHPIMVEVVLKKLQHPHMSYSAIGASMSTPCHKQNILHHLKQAVKLFPELQSALITDTRSNGGHYALRTVASQHRKTYVQNRLRELMYGNDPLLREKTIKEINAIFKAPFENATWLSEFDLYTKYDNGEDDKDANDKD